MKFETARIHFLGNDFATVRCRRRYLSYHLLREQDVYDIMGVLPKLVKNNNTVFIQ